MSEPWHPRRNPPAVVRAGGEALMVRRYGRGGTRLMLLHGGPGLDHQTLLPLADLLSRDHDIWLPDLPGHGGSLQEGEPLPGAYGLRRRTAAWLKGLERDHQGPEILCGHSLGAWLARDLVRRGAVVPGMLILLCPPSRPAQGEPIRQESEFRQAREEWLRYLQLEVPGPMSGDFRRAALDTKVIAPSRYTRLLRTLHRVFQSRPEPFDPPCPVLVLGGRLDHTTSPEDAEEVASRTGGARLQILPGCGHFTWAEHAAPTATAILDFIRGHSGNSGTGT